MSIGGHLAKEVIFLFLFLFLFSSLFFFPPVPAHKPSIPHLLWDCHFYMLRELWIIASKSHLLFKSYNTYEARDSMHGIHDMRNMNTYG